MDVFKKRSTAFVILVIVLVFGTLFGVHRSVGAETKKIEAMFYDGVYIEEDDYTQRSIAELLDVRATDALGLVTIANHYDALAELADSLRQSRLALMDADTIAGKYEANVKMQSAYEALYDALISQSLTDSEQAAAQSYAETLDGAQSVIQSSTYNDAVASFREELGAFPVNLLKNPAFVTLPEYFGAEE